MPRSYRIRCECCLGMAGVDVQWTKMLLTSWLCNDCWDYLSNKVGCKDCYEEEGNKSEALKFREAIENMPSSKEIRMANTIKYGPAKRLNKNASVWVEPVENTHRLERIHGS